MVGGDDEGDDMAVELSWPDAQPVAPRRAAAPASVVPAARRPAAPPAGASQAGAPPRPPRPDAVTGAQLLAAIQRVGADVIALGRAQQQVPGQDLNRVASGLDEVVTLLRSRAVGPDDDDPFDAVVDVLASVTRRQDELAAATADVADRLSDRSDLASVLEWAERRERLLTERLDRIEAALPRRTAEGAPAGATDDTLLGVLEHLTTLSSLVTGTSRASSAELEALQRRILQSLAGIDDVRTMVQEGLVERPMLSDVDVRRIADEVTESLLENVRVEAEEEDGAV